LCNEQRGAFRYSRLDTVLGRVTTGDGNLQASLLLMSFLEMRATSGSWHEAPSAHRSVG